MPNRWLCDSRPFFDEPCPFLCAMSFLGAVLETPRGAGRPLLGRGRLSDSSLAALARLLRGLLDREGQRGGPVDPPRRRLEADGLGLQQRAIAEAFEAQL